MQVLVSVELCLWSIFHDMAAIGCPLPADSKWVWGGDKSGSRKGTLSPRPPGGRQWEFYKSWGTQDNTSAKRGGPARAGGGADGAEGTSASGSQPIAAGMKLGAWVVNDQSSHGWD